MEPIRIDAEGRIVDGRNRYRACLSISLEPTFEPLPADVNPWEFVWSANAERRHLPEGTKAVIRVRQQKGSAGWAEQQDARQTEANRRRSEATSRQGRNDDGTFGTGLVSRDTAPVDTQRHREEVAQAAGVSSATAQRALEVDARRPDLADRGRIIAPGARLSHAAEPG